MGEVHCLSFGTHACNVVDDDQFRTRDCQGRKQCRGAANQSCADYDDFRLDAWCAPFASKYSVRVDWVVGQETSSPGTRDRVESLCYDGICLRPRCMQAGNIALWRGRASAHEYARSPATTRRNISCDLKRTVSQHLTSGNEYLVATRAQSFSKFHRGALATIR